MLTTKATKSSGRTLSVLKNLAIAGTATLAVAAATLSGASAAGAQVSRHSARMTLAKSIAPSPAFLVSGVCGTAGPTDTAVCTEAILKSIAAARKSEPLNAIPATFKVAAFDKLTDTEQIFAIADIERTARGLAPIEAITTQLDKIAASGATAQGDPATSLPLRLTGGGESTYYGSNWAEGTANALGADYYWMYDDGTNSPNGDCAKTTDSGCWGHRENILANVGNANYCPAGSKVNTLMGAAEVTSKVRFSPSIAEIFVNDCGSLPTDQVFTWADVQKLVFGH